MYSSDNLSLVIKLTQKSDNTDEWSECIYISE